MNESSTGPPSRQLQIRVPRSEQKRVLRRAQCGGKIGFDNLCFAMQSKVMQTDWASENLQVIRTLMERSAVYRRALAPVMGAIGLTGLAAAGLAVVAGVKSGGAFAGYWMAVAAVCLAEAFLLVRRQALKEQEPFWSP